MTNNQILAEWCGYKMCYDGYYSDVIHLERPRIRIDEWQPESDMNQLKMLMDKFIEKNKTVWLEYLQFEDRFELKARKFIDVVGYVDIGAVTGKSISECDYNVISNYVGGLKSEQGH